MGELSVCGTAALGLARGCDRPGILAGPAPVPTDLDTPAGAHNMSAALHTLGLLPAIAAVVFAAGPVVAAQDEVSGPEATGSSGDSTIVVTAASQQEFPRIAVQFEVHQPDGSFLLDATREDFRVTEDGKDVQVLDFQASQTTRANPTTIVLVVDHSGSMEQENRIRSLKQCGRFVPDEVARGLAGGRGGLQLRGRAALPVHDRPRSGAQRCEPPTAGWLYPVLRCRGRSARPARRTGPAAGSCWP